MRRFEEASGIGHTKAYELIGAGEIETVKIGRRRMVIMASYKRYLVRLRKQQGGVVGKSPNPRARRTAAE
jgi:hypothetical protein